MSGRPHFELSERWLLILLAAVQFTHIMDFMIMMPLGPQLMRELSLSAPAFSVLIAAYTTMAGVVGLLLAPFIDRYDRRTVLLAAYSGFLLGTLGCALATTSAELLVARAVCGAFGGVSSTIILAMVGDLIPIERRGEAMGIVMTAFSAAAAFGVPFGLFLAQQFVWETPFFLLAGMSLVVLILLWSCLPPVRGHLSAGRPASWSNFLTLLRDRNAWSALSLMVSLVFGHFTMIPFLSPHLVFNLKFPESHLAVVYIIGGVLTVFSAPWIGRLSDRLGRARVFTVVVGAAATVILVLTHVGPLPYAATLTLTGLFFIFASGRYVPAQTVIASAVASSQRGAFMSLSACTRDLCTGLAAVMAGRVLVQTPDALRNVHLLGLLAAAVSLASIWLIRRVRVAANPV